jgi:NADPH-dependent glutamate synthase beta subunit-like oxidoreductase/ferredoxin
MQSSSNNMVKLTIDNIPVEVSEGTTLMQAAGLLGIEIPSMCYLPGHHAHPSCMVCLVKETTSNQLLTSCAHPAEEGMNIITHSAEVREARREAIELLLSDHVGDCEAPCRLSCPASMNIALMNRYIAGGQFDEALAVVWEAIALPMVLGYICPAPCEKACRRRPLEGAVSICLLKRLTAQDERRRNDLPHISHEINGKRVAVIGTGPAGLSAAFYVLRSGHECILFDKNSEPGGTLRYAIPEEKLPRTALDADIEVIRRMGAVFRMNTTVTDEMFETDIYPKFDAVILACGSKEAQPFSTFELTKSVDKQVVNRYTFATARPGVFACGAIIRDQQMAVRSCAQGRMAATEAEIFLQTHRPKRIPPKFNSAIGPLKVGELAEYLKESVPGKRIEPTAGYMGGFTPAEAILEARRCLHCDCRKPFNCKLRNYADEYQANRKRFASPERKMLTKEFHHDLVVYEPEKCIRCGLCVEIAQREGEKTGLTYVGRGFDVRISIPFSQTMKEALERAARACIEACPTGAMAERGGDGR